MKLLITAKIVALTFVLVIVVAYANGADYISVKSGSWNDTKTWKLTSGSGLGYPIAGDNATIDGGNTITVSADAACAAVTFSSNKNETNILNIASHTTLTVSGLIQLYGSKSTNELAVGDGFLNAGSISFKNSQGPRNVVLTISTGTVTVSGNISEDGHGGDIEFSAAGLLKIGGAMFTSTNTNNILKTVSGSTVEYNGAAQTVQNFTYYNLTLSGSGVKTTTGITVNEILSMEGTATASVQPTYGGAATLQYKGSVAQTTGPEFPSSWTGSGGVRIENANGVTLNEAKNINSTPFTIGSLVPGSLFYDGGFQLSGTGTLNLASGAMKLGTAANATTFPNFGTTNIAAGTTVEYAATPNQSVRGLNYSNLILSGGGIKTLPATGLSVGNDFTITGTVATTIVGALTVGRNLNISATSNLTVAPAVNLTVAGILTNNAGAAAFVLQSDATGTASLLHNTNNVPATVQRYFPGAAEGWHFISSPVDQQSISGNWLPAGTYGNGTGYDLYAWNEPSSCWIYRLDNTSPINWTTVHPGSNFVVGRGYLYSTQAANPTNSFVGNLNNGPLSDPLTSIGTDLPMRGFCLVGNPYPSAIDWQAASGWSRTNLKGSGGGYDMWIWNPAANNYGVCNSFPGSTGTNGVTRYIAAMQGFFVLASAAGNLTMDNGVRVHDLTTPFKSAEISPDILSLVVQSEAHQGFDEVRLLFGYDKNQSGARKLFSNIVSAPSLFIPSGNECFTMKYLTDTIDYPCVPIMFKPGSDGNYTLRCSFDFDKFKTVMLEDRLTHTFHNLKIESTYRFQASKKDDANRFVVYFGDLQNHPKKDLPVRIYPDGVHLMIDLSMIDKETTLFVYDLMGRLVSQQKLSGKTQHLLDIKAHQQVLVVYLKNPEGSLCRKLLWGGN